MSDNPWYGLVADEDQRVWDGYAPIPDPGQNPALDSFLAGKNLDHRSLVRLGARLSRPNVLAVAFEGGIKYRDVVRGRKWSSFAAEFERLKIIQGQDRSRAIICEGETDAARLTMLYDCDVAAMPAGATNWRPGYTEQVKGYAVVYVGLDNDEAGEAGYAKIKAHVPQAVRFAPPTPKDWCQLEGEGPPLPPPPEPVPETPVLVPAKDLFDLDVPDVISWYDGAILPVAGEAIIHAPAKYLKSWIAMSLASCLAQGEPWAGFEPTEEPARVAYMNFEIPWAYYRERVGLYAQHARRRDLFDENFLSYEPVERPKLTVGNRRSEDEVLGNLVEANIDVVFIDPVRRVMGFADMNAENEVRRMLFFAERLTREGMTVVLTHHDNKESTKRGGGESVGMTGSGAWEGDVDTIVSVSLPPGCKREDPLRNVNFLLRNGQNPAPKGFQIMKDGRTVWHMESFIESENDQQEGVQI